MNDATQGTEYAVLQIDANGDCIDRDHFDAKSDALADIADWPLPDGETVALVVERYWRKHREDGHELDRDETVIATKGDNAALLAGQWVTH